MKEYFSKYYNNKSIMKHNRNMNKLEKIRKDYKKIMEMR